VGPHMCDSAFNFTDTSCLLCVGDFAWLCKDVAGARDHYFSYQLNYLQL